METSNYVYNDDEHWIDRYYLFDLSGSLLTLRFLRVPTQAYQLLRHGADEGREDGVSLENGE